MIYITLFVQFFLIGLFAVGGGAATIPFLFDLSKKYPWFTSQELSNMIAISESTPGPIGVNMATFAGFEASGFFGGLIATLGLITPSIIVVILICKLVSKFSCEESLHKLLKALQPAVVALILYANYHIALVSFNSMHSVLVFFSIFFLMCIYPKNPIFYIVFSAFLGLVFQL